MLVLITGCRPKTTPEVTSSPPPVEESFEWAMSFRASDGLAQYEDSAYSSLQTVDGSIELYNTTVTKYLITDQKLSADCSDMGGVNVCGKAWIHKSNLRQASIFHDNVRFYESHVAGTLTICGNLLACDSTFAEAVHVGADVTAERSCFQSCLTARAEIIDLHGSTAQDIVVEPTGPYYDPQVVRLAEGSVVTGDITFKSGRGKVCLDKCSRIEGQIYGGHVIGRHYWQDH
jgi:hypothetical protein